jgi:predicted permease
LDPKLLIDTIRTVTVIIGSLMLGYALRKSGRASQGFADSLNRFTLAWGQSVVIALSLWTMKSPDARTLMLPVYGIILILLMWPPTALLARFMRQDRPTTGSSALAGMFSNVGFTYGTFLCFVALGPQGAALGSVYCASFMPAVFTLGYYTARRYAGVADRTILGALGDLFRNAETRNPTLGILLGLALNITHLKPPTETRFILDMAIPTTTAAFLLFVGYGLRLSALREYWRECVAMHLAKFLISPLLGAALAIPFGYWVRGDRSLLVVCLIEAATPVGIMSVVVTDLFGLNRRLAGALWLTTNLTGVLLAPLILWLAHQV